MIKYNAFYQLTTGQIEMAKHKLRIWNTMFYLFDPDFLPDDELWTIKDGKPYKVLVDYVTESDFNEALTSKDLAIITGRRASGKTSFVEILSKLQVFDGLYILESQMLSHVPRKLREHAGMVIDLKHDGSEANPFQKWFKNYKLKKYDLNDIYPSSPALEKRAREKGIKVANSSVYGVMFKTSDNETPSQKFKRLKDSLTSDIYSACIGDLISLLEQDADNEDVWMVIRKIRKSIKERNEVEETINKIKRLEERHNGKM